MYRILSISGGGVRGLIPARELSILSSKELDQVDCFGGTSTGGILALGAAAGFTFGELFDLYQRWIPEIFKARGWWDRFWRLDELRRANYDNVGLIRACKAVFGEMRMTDLLAEVMIPSVHLDGCDQDNGVRSAQTTWYTRGATNASKTYVWEVAVKTASAPVYFPSYRGYVDGGLSMNNPAAKAAQMAYNSGIALEHIELLAVTTGSGPLYKADQRNDWGLAQWGPDLINLILRLQEQTTLDLLRLNQFGYYAIADYALPTNVPLDGIKWAREFGEQSYTKRPSASSAVQGFQERLRRAR